MFFHEIARFTNQCPQCTVRGSVVQEQRCNGREGALLENIQCLACGKALETLPENPEVAAMVQQTALGASLQEPYAVAIPEARLIRQVLYAALLVRYQLSPCYAVEGGVQGVIKGHYLELRNDDEQIGLIDSGDSTNHELVGHVLTFYADMLADLFVRELRWKNKSFGFGAVFTAEPHQLVALFHIVIAKALKGLKRPIPRDVFHKWAELRDDPLARMYAGGLTDKDIVKLFVPPPL